MTPSAAAREVLLRILVLALRLLMSFPINGVVQPQVSHRIDRGLRVLGRRMSSSPAPPRPAPLTPEAAAFCEAASQRPTYQDVPVEVARAMSEAGMRAGGGPSLPMRRVEDLLVHTAGSPDVPVRLYLPTLDPLVRLPLVLWVHGGGWVVGSVASYDQCCRRIAAWGDVAVVSVEYRRSPEHPYPAALDDVATAYAYTVTALAQQYSTVVNGEQCVVAGDSAGGNLAAALCLRLARTNTLPKHLWPKAQVLVYPCLDFTRQGRSHATYAHGHVLTARLTQWFMAQYLGPTPDASLCRHEEVSPLLTDDVTLFPPTMLLVAEADPLADDSFALQHRMEHDPSASPVQSVVFKGLVHAFFTHWEAFPQAQDAMHTLTTYLNDRRWQQAQPAKL